MEHKTRPVNTVVVKMAPQSRHIVINFETGKGRESNLMTSELHIYVTSAIVKWIRAVNSRNLKSWNYGKPHIELQLDTSLSKE